MRPLLLLLVAGCPEHEVIAIGTDVVDVSFAVVPPASVEAVAFEIRVDEVVFEADGPRGRVSVASQVDETFTPLVREETVSVWIESGTYQDPRLTVALAAVEGPALLFVATRGEALLQVEVDALALELPVPSAAFAGEVRVRLWFDPDAWGLDGVEGVVDASSGPLYDDVLAAIRSSTVLESLP